MSAASVAAIADQLMVISLWHGAAIALVAAVIGWTCNLGQSFAEAYGERLAERVNAERLALRLGPRREP